jgi:hypothetical protein
MKKIYLLSIMWISILAFSFSGYSQTTIILQPDESTSSDASIWDYSPGTNYGTHPDFMAAAWTSSGTPTISRSLINFDLSSIPANATIISSTLSLYHHSSTNTIGHSTMDGSNTAWLRRITSSWSESTVNWNNQPSTTTQNQVTLPASTNDSMDYPNIDVTNLISDIYNNPSGSFGMMLMLQTESYYRSLLFASSGETNTAKRPKLTVTYTINNDTCVTLKRQGELGQDADLWDYSPNTNYGTHPDFTGCAWTSSGDPTVSRGLLEFNLNSIPANATISSASLFLYHYNSPWTTGHSTMNGSNACWLRRVTSTWDDATVTWNTQPSTTTQNQVTLPASTNDTMNYPNIDVTSLITDMINNPSTSYGMMIMLQTESYYRSLLFASGDCPDLTKLPILKICYHTNSAVPEYKDPDNEIYEIYPNPAEDNISIAFKAVNGSEVLLEFYSVSGELIDRVTIHSASSGTNIYPYALDPGKYPMGVYFVKLISGTGAGTQRFVKVD